MGKKYIIELEDKPFHKGNGDFLYRVKGFNSLVFDMNGVGKLTPYTEPDTEKIRKEAYDKGFDAGRTLNTGKYEKGLDDAWECARKIVDCAIPYEALENYLEIGECTADVIKHLPASKAIEVVRQYEQKQEEIQVGDEVVGLYGTRFNMRGFVTKENNSPNFNVVWDEGDTGCYTKGDFRKTGRHFPEIAEVLQKMREE